VDQVRFERMVPAEIVARRDACSLAYLPVGALEWHGDHMPFGTDYLAVDWLTEQAARRFGGVVFPPLYYGDVRYHIQACRVEWRNTYVATMQVPIEFASAFPLQDADGSPGGECPTQPDDGPAPKVPLEFSLQEQELAFAKLIARAMLQIHLYGFRNIILMPGHGPNPARCSEAAEIYRENVLRRSAFGGPARTATWFYIGGSRDMVRTLKKHWIHADRWETSVLMATAPDTIHMDLLPKDPKTIPPAYLGQPYLTETEGYNPERKEDWPSYDAWDPRNADEAYGKQQLDEILGELGKFVEGFLAGA